MKTQEFSEVQLKELVEKGKTTTVEPVKKGEILFKDCLGCFAGKRIKENPPRWQFKDKKGRITKTIIKVGELVQAVNEKGNWAWLCPKCNHINYSTLQNINPERLIGVSSYCTANHTESIQQTSLLVRLEKIEKEDYKICEACDGEEGRMENKEWVDCSACEGEGGDWNSKFWFKTWRVSK